MMAISTDQRLLLETIGKYDGQWNWYKLGRLCLSQLDNPAEFKLGPLMDAGYVEERPHEGEPLPRLFLTVRGRAVLTTPKPGEIGATDDIEAGRSAPASPPSHATT